MKKEFPENTLGKKTGITGSRGFLKESSVIDPTGKSSNLSLKELASTIDRNLAEKLRIKEEYNKRRIGQQEFLLKLMPEIFHDVRSPFISIIGFAGLFKQKNHSEKEIREYSGEIIEESNSALKRLEALEHFFRLFLKVDSQTLEKLDIYDTIDWTLALLKKKISRKKLNITKKTDSALKDRDFRTCAGNVELLLLELLCRFIEEVGNKAAITLVTEAGDDFIKVSMLAEPGPNGEEIAVPEDYQPSFEVECTRTKVLPGKGFSLLIKEGNV